MSIKTKLNWYKHRLAAMSAAEIAHRVGELVHKHQDRFRSPYRLRDYGPLPTLPGLKDGISGKAVDDTLLAQWIHFAGKVQKGEFYMLGQAWPPCVPDKKWHLDPVTGSFWPDDEYCFRINYRHTDKKGDVKYVWELGRLQHLQVVAALSYKQKDTALAQFCLEELESWIDHNEPHKGVHWSSGIELGLRVVSILVIITFCEKYISEGLRMKVWATLREHGWWLARYPSRFSSANNHLTAEGLGLFLIGVLCTPLPQAKKWEKAGWNMLLDTADKQILADGVGAEQTPNYTAVVLEMLLVGLHVARAMDKKVPDTFTRKIELGGEYLRWFMDAGGHSPRIGDDDNARVLGAYRLDEPYIKSVLGCIAAVYKRADLTPPTYTTDFRNCLFCAPPAAAAPAQGVHTFEDGGYTVGRHMVNGREVWLGIDHGYLGYLSIAAHGHADALAVWLHMDGKPVLADSGTYLYHSGGTWRNYFRGTTSHNTLCMEGVDSSTMSGHFNWSHKANASRTLIETGPDHWQIDAVHDGYQQRFGAIHRRRVSLTPSRGLVIEDSIHSNEPRNVSINFHLYPGLTAEKQDNAIHILRGGVTIIRLMHLSPLKAEIHTPGTENCGWYSPTFGIKQEITRICFWGVLHPNAKAITDLTFVWPA